MKKILYFNTYDQSDVDIENRIIKETGADAEIVLKNNMPEDSLISEASNFDGIVVIYSEFPRKIIEKLSRVKVISLQSIGYNNVDIEAASEHGIMVANTPDYCLDEVASHTVALALSLVRRIPYLNNRLKNNEWKYTDLHLHRIKGQTFGLIAFGNIPKTMLPMIKGFGMVPLVYAPTKTKEYVESFGAKKAENLEELLRNSDIISMHLPLTEKTKNFIGEKEFSMMKKTAIFINTSRGGVVDEEAAYKALTENKISGAAFDVLQEEKTCTSPLIKLDNCIVTPHMAYFSDEAILDMRRTAIMNVLDPICFGKRPKNLVNQI